MLGYSESTRRPACRGGIYGQRSSSCECTEAKETARVLPCTPLNISSFVEFRTKVNGVGGTYTGHTGAHGHTDHTDE
jgi:hypothetical protein